MPRKNRKKQNQSIWKRLNEPAPEPSLEFIRGFTVLVALALLLLFAGPYFGEDNAVYRSAYGTNHRITTYPRITNQDELRMHEYAGMREYAGLFEPLQAAAYEQAPRVAGAVTDRTDKTYMTYRTDSSDLYDYASTVLGAFAEGTAQILEPETLIPDIYWSAGLSEFGRAAGQVLDISDQTGPYVEFFQPGVSAVWNAWLDLMKDPVFHE